MKLPLGMKKRLYPVFFKQVYMFIFHEHCTSTSINVKEQTTGLCLCITTEPVPCKYSVCM